MGFRARWKNSEQEWTTPGLTFGFLPSLIPMFESQNFLDVQLVFPGTAILRDFADKDCDLRHWTIHPVE
jgi:hypothetical protein